jgi:two-component system chemotaxis response regulator CheB
MSDDQGETRCGHDRVVVGASAGGVEALIRLVGGLPAALPAAVFVVLHVPGNGTSVLPQILSRAGPLRATHAIDEEPIVRGHIYVAPPDHHLLVHRGRVRVVRGPRENRHRPAVDPLFRTAARAYGERVIGVILSGTLDDGTAGLLAVKALGGIAVVQDPRDALFAGMPRSALDYVEVDHVLAAREIGPVLATLTHQPVAGGGMRMSGESATEAAMAELDPDATHQAERPGTPSPFSCPECGGVLWELGEEALTRFRCRTGHAFTADALMADQADVLESALWVGLRSLEEKAAMAERLVTRARDQGRPLMASRFETQVREAREQAEVIRRLLLTSRASGGEEEPGARLVRAGGGHERDTETG